MGEVFEDSVQNLRVIPRRSHGEQSIYRQDERTKYSNSNPSKADTVYEINFVIRLTLLILKPFFF